MSINIHYTYPLFWVYLTKIQLFMKFTCMALLFILSYGCFGQSNNLELESIYHRFNVGDFYIDGLEYYQMPQNQLRPVEFSAVVKNNGENEMTNCFLQVDIENGGTVLYTLFSDSVTIASGDKDSLNLNAPFNLSEPVGDYVFNYYVISDELEIDYSDNKDSVNFQITENTLSRSNFDIADSTKNYYADSLHMISFGYVFKLENDACLSAVYPWVTYDIVNSMGTSLTNASLFVLDSVNNEYMPLGLTSNFIPTIDELGGRYRISFDNWNSDLLGGNIYLITINTPSNFTSFYLSQSTIDSTAYRAYPEGVPGGGFIENSPLINTRIIKMDIEFETSAFCNLKIKEDNRGELKVYPNPANTLLTVEIPQTVMVMNVRIVDIAGRVVEQHQLMNQDKFTWNTTHIENGTYFINITDETNTILFGVKKAVIQH